MEISIELLQVGLGLLILGLISGAWLSGRARFAPLGYWPVGWATMVAMGVARVAGGPLFIEFGLTAIFWGLMVAGAYRYADVAVPTWILPAALGAASALGVMCLAGWDAVASSLIVALVRRPPRPVPGR